MKRRQFILGTALASLATLVAPLISYFARPRLDDHLYFVDPVETPFVTTVSTPEGEVRVFRSEFGDIYSDRPPHEWATDELRAEATEQVERRVKAMLDDIYRI